MDKFERLIGILDTVKGRTVNSVSDELANSLADCWCRLEGNDDTRMEPRKLTSKRIERLSWTPPTLTFHMERHGGTVLGSTRAQVIGYTVNLEKRTVKAEVVTHRQLEPMQPVLDTQAICDQLVARIVAKELHPTLEWSADQTRVHLVMGKLIPEGSASKDTLLNRRKRLARQVTEALQKHGWTRVDCNAEEVIQFSAQK